MKNTSITQILRTARQSVALWASGSTWTVSSPQQAKDPSGPCVEVVVRDYALARTIASNCKCSVALAVGDVQGDHFDVVFTARELLADGFSWDEVAVAMIKHSRGIPHGVLNKRFSRLIEGSVKSPAA